MHGRRDDVSARFGGTDRGSGLKPEKERRARWILPSKVERHALLNLISSNARRRLMEKSEKQDRRRLCY